jgi:hypothetical protein
MMAIASYSFIYSRASKIVMGETTLTSYDFVTVDAGEITFIQNTTNGE